MHTPGHNPFINEYYGTYTTGPGSSAGQTIWEYAGSPGEDYQSFLSSLEASVNQFLQTEAPQYAHYGEIPYYSYQGISPDIMQTLTGVFGEYNPEFSGLDVWGTEGNEALQDYLESELGLTGTSAANYNLIDAGEFNLDSPLAGVNIFDPESIANALSEVGGLDATPFKAGEIQALTPEMLEKTTSVYYNPYEEAERASLIEKRGKNIAGAETGGFAGSGGRRAGLSAADRMYSSGYGDLLSDIMKMKAGAQEDVFDTIYGWQELLAEATPD